MNNAEFKLYEREVIAHERQAEALERIANALNVNAIDTRYGISNLAEAVACLVYAINDKDTVIQIVQGDDQRGL